MATNTPKLSLPKPEANENFTRAKYNELIDAIDTQVGAKTDAAATHMADTTKHVTPADKTKWDGMIPATQKGAASGVATLGTDGKVPASQLSVSAPADASTAQKGVVQLSNATDSTSETLAATPKAVKDAKDGLSTQIGILSSTASDLEILYWMGAV